MPRKGALWYLEIDMGEACWVWKVGVDREVWRIRWVKICSPWDPVFLTAKFKSGDVSKESNNCSPRDKDGVRVTPSTVTFGLGFSASSARFCSCDKLSLLLIGGKNFNWLSVAPSKPLSSVSCKIFAEVIFWSTFSATSLLVSNQSTVLKISFTLANASTGRPPSPLISGTSSITGEDVESISEKITFIQKKKKEESLLLNQNVLYNISPEKAETRIPLLWNPLGSDPCHSIINQLHHG